MFASSLVHLGIAEHAGAHSLQLWYLEWDELVFYLPRSVTDRLTDACRLGAADGYRNRVDLDKLLVGR